MTNRTRTRKTRLRKKHRKARLIKLSIILVLLISAIVGLAVFSRSDRAKINSITVSGNNLVPADELKQIAEKGSATALLGIFNKGNIILYPRKKVEENITKSFKSIQNASVSFTSANTLAINITERKPSYMWCASDADAGATKNCFYMDDTGYIFSPSPDLSGNIFFIYYGLIDQKNAIGSTYLSADRLKSLKSFVDSVKTLGANPVGILADNEDDYELLLSNSAKILFNDKTDFLKTSENLKAIVEEQKQTNPKIDFFANLDYVDLRFGSKAYFKMK